MLTNISVQEIEKLPTGLINWLINPNRKLTMTNSSCTSKESNSSLDVIDSSIEESIPMCPFTCPSNYQLSMRKIRLCFHRKSSYYCKSCRRIKRDKLKSFRTRYRVK